MTSRRLRYDGWADSGRRADAGRGRGLAALPPNRDGGTTPFARTCQCGRSRALRTALLASVLISVAVSARAQDATWLGAVSGDFNDAANWSTPTAVPTGTASFGTSSQTNVSFSAATTIGGWTFNTGAPSYTFTNNSQTLQFNGAGIVINGGSASIANDSGAILQFFNTSTAGSATITNTATLIFLETSTAGSATIANNASGFLQFRDTSTAGSATITNDNILQFVNTSTAGSATITNNASLQFVNTSTAGSATITNNASLQFFNTSTGGTARFINGAAGIIDLSFSNAGVTAGSIEGAGTISLGAKNLAVGGNNRSTTFSGVLQDGGIGGGDRGSLTKTGTGTLTLSGTNTYTGATTVNDGTLQAGAANAFAPFSAFTVAAGATLDLNGFNQTIGSLAGGGAVSLGSATLTTGNDNTSTIFAGTIGGLGGLTKIGTGTLTLAGSSSYLGATAVDAGTLQAGAANAFAPFSAFTVAAGATLDLNGFNQTIGSLAGVGDVSLGSATLTTGNDNTSTIFAGTIGGPGGLTKIGTGTLTLSGTNAYTGATTVDAGTLLVNGSIASSIITNNATLGFFGTGTAGSAAITNNNLLQFSDASTAGSATITSLGNVEFFGTSTAGTASITNNGSDVLQFFDSSTAGSATINNNFGIVEFFNTSTAGSAAITNNNAMAFRDTSTAGSATITNNASLRFFNTSTAGTARFINGAAGTIDLSFLESAGMTAGSIEGAGIILLGSKNLAVGGNNLSTTFSGALQDGGAGGSLTKTGTGTLTLSGSNTYTGATTVDAGTLLVNGSIASSILTTVNAGGTLGGNGTVGNTIINGGTLSAGTSIGTLTVSGSLVMTAASTYLVEVSPTNADRTNVTGTATLGGTVQAVFAPGSYVTRSYTILSATGGLGGTTFSGLTVVPAGFTADLSYTSTDVLLNLTAALGTGGALNQNQRNVAGALNGFFNNGGALPPNFVGVFGLTGGNLANALTLLSGEAATGAQQGAFQLMGQFLGIMLDPFVDGRGGIGGSNGAAIGFAPERAEMPDDVALAYAKAMKAPVTKAPTQKAPSFEQRWTAWGGAYGGYNRTSGDAAVVGSHDVTARTAGFAAGLDYQVTRDTVAGFALAGGGTDWSLAQGLGGGKSDAIQAGAYAATRAGPAYLAASLAVANHWMSTDRTAFAADHLTASFNAWSLGARVEGGYRFATALGGVTPYAAGQAQSFRTPSYSETDVNGGGFALSYDARTATAVRSELGARFDHVAAVAPEAVLTLRGRLAWAHDWTSDPTRAAVFQALPGASFIVNGAAPAKDSALVSAGSELRLANGVILSGKLDGELARRSSTYAGTGTVRVSW